MSAKVKIGSKLPGGKQSQDFNGLDSMADWLVDPENEDELLGSFVLWRIKKVEHDVGTGEDVPTLEIAKVEPLGEVGELGTAIVKIVQDAAAKRLGRKPVPLEMGQVAEGYDPEQRELGDED